jgi:predicted N-acetyltransferase YhbS
VRIAPLSRDELEPARALLQRTLEHDRVDVVAEEKLFGDNGARAGVTLGAWKRDTLVGVLASAGRWIKLVAVDETQRRKGIATRLVEELDPALKLRVGDHPGNYLTPGIDARYEAGRAFFAAQGFRPVGSVENVRAPLDHPLQRTEVAGYTIRRIDGADADARARLLAWVEATFAPVWAMEVARASDGPRHAVHAAYVAGSDGDAPVAFAAADGNNQGLGWFGPAGTDPAHRGKRLGEALLVRCLEDVRGLPEAGVIAWIGPKQFYAKTVGAVDDRTFIQLERDVK